MRSEDSLSQKPTLYLIDGHSYIYRAFHAIRNLSTSKGFPTNAIYGFTQMLLKIVRDKHPEYLVVVFDAKGPTMRHKEFEDYKANRPEMPDLLIPQIPFIHRLVEGFRIPVLMQEGYEADDLIGTLSRQGEELGFQVTIVTSDKDMLQLLTPNIKIYDTLRDKSFGEEKVKERFGMGPEGVVEIMGLMGDSVDNIPGVPGVGEKTAVQLIQQFGTIENVLSHLDQIKKPKLKEALEKNREQARLSRRLATIQTDCPVEFQQEVFRVSEPDHDSLSALFQELEFTSLLKVFSPKATTTPIPLEFKNLKDTVQLKKILETLRKSKTFILTLETDDKLLPMEAELKGLGLLSPEGEGGYLSLNKSPKEREALIHLLQPVFEDPSIAKMGHHLKRTVIILKRFGVDLCSLGFDTMIAAYLLNPGRSEYSLETLSLELLGEELENGKSEKTLPGEDIYREMVQTLKLVRDLEGRLKGKGEEGLFREMEMPLIPVLARMEMNGFKLDVSFLEDMSKELERQLQGLMERIYRLAGQEFNINSPKQLQEILFQKLKLTPIKKTKTGFSTDEGVLTQLSLQHELPVEILNFRQLTKLKSTYVDALPRLVNPKTQRLHTSLNQTVAATGRLSSSDPNLQNIPIRTEIGRRIREAFIVEEGNWLLSADYNQIELRILAHLSEDERFVEAFQSGEDIHLRTAMEIFGLSTKEITVDMRRAAKTVNFGIIYGLSPYGLAVQLGVSQPDAKKYIDNYFSHYSGVKAFIDRTIEEARKNGFVTTLFQRKRSVADIQSENNAARGFGERIATNTPIQGSAADLIKLAMIRIDQRLIEKSLSTRMILQIHDELLFEVPEPELDQIKEMVQAEMEGVFPMKVPLKVDLGTGRNWAEAH